MYKKIILILSALIIFSLPYQQQYAEGAILSKVASTGVKKAVKEIIKESAFDTAVNIFLDEAFTMALEEKTKYAAQQDYELFCGKKMPDLITCEKPMQIKSVLTDVDKANIGNQAEIELDKLITGGKGFTRWQKFLDFILPIWLISLSFTAITYALDPEVRSLFNEAGYNALVALGIIKPVESKDEVIPFETVELPPQTNESGYTQAPDSWSVNTFLLNASSTFSNLGINGLNMPNQNLISQLYFKESYTDFNYILGKINGTAQFTIWGDSKKRIDLLHSVYGADVSAVVQLNGVTKPTTPSLATGATRIAFGQNPDVNITANKIKSIMHRSPYQVGDFYYTDVLYNSVDGDIVKIQIKSTVNNMTKTVTGSTFDMGTIDGHTFPVAMTVYKNQVAKKTILPPIYEEIETELDLLKDSPYMDANGQIALVPPSSLPYIQTSTGLELTPEIDETTGDKKFTTPSGESVPEDDITVGEPNIQYNPKPEPNTVTPPATQTNPNPEPIPLTPAQPTTPPPKTPTPIETLPPVIPEGESCDVGLKLPKFNPLMHTISDAFPFSIPFDLKDGFDALFAEMGNEKPEFDYKFKFMGDEQSWKITIPDYFDSWKAFTDSFLIFIFDIGIIYAIYRFMGGGN